MLISRRAIVVCVKVQASTATFASEEAKKQSLNGRQTPQSSLSRDITSL